MIFIIFTLAKENLTMNAKERVLTTFSHHEPDRVPRWCGASPEFWEHAKKQLATDDEGLAVRFGDDFRRITAPYTGASDGASPFGIYRDGVGCGMAVNHPLQNASVEEVLNYAWPDPDKVDISRLREEAQKHAANYAILGGDWAPFWHDACDLVGMENLMIGMYTDPKWAHAIFDKTFEFYYHANERIFAEAGDLIDIFFVGNDLGSNNGALISDELFREYLWEKFKRLADLGHAYGAKFQLHCCGGFSELMPALIEAGVDAVHAIQPYCRGMELARLKKDFGEKLVFNGCIDSQSVLIEGDPAYVKEATIKVLETMKNGGGFVAGASHDYLLDETPLENVLVMFDTIQQYGGYDNQ